jgi:hypothetical protein
MFSFVLIAGTVLLVGGGVVFLLSKTAFRNFLGAGRAQLTKISQEAIEADPVAVLQDRKIKAFEQLAKASDEQRLFGGNLKDVQNQVEDGLRKTAEVEALLKRAINDGNEERQLRYANQLAWEKEQLEKNQKQAHDWGKMYNKNLEEMNLVQQELVFVDQEARRLNVELKMSEQQKRMAQLVSTCSVSIDTESIEEAKQVLRRKIAMNQGAAMATNDLNSGRTSEIQDRAEERKSKARELLEKYKEDTKSNPSSVS